MNPYSNACNDSSDIVATLRPTFGTLSRRAHYSLVLAQNETVGNGKNHTSCGHGTIFASVVFPRAKLPCAPLTFPTSYWIFVA